MKLTPALLAGSLLANAVLGFVLWQGPAAPRTARVLPAAASQRSTDKSTVDLAALQSALATSDATALTAAGCPPEVIRTLLLGRALEVFQQRALALHPPAPSDDRFWKPRPASDPRREAANQVELSRAVREFSDSLRAATGKDLESIFGQAESRYSFLPSAKQEQLRRIERDYADMESQIRAEEAGFQLPSDREKLKLLQEEKERDLASVLSAEERAEYAQRNSNTAQVVRQNYGAAIQNEAQYRQIFDLQKAFEERYGNPANLPPGMTAAEWRQSRSAAEQELQKNISAALPAEQVAALQRKSDPDVRTTEALARRLNLPDTVSDTLLATRASYSAQSLQINANPALSTAERKTQFAALAARAESDLQAVLGTVGTQAYLPRSTWINLLKNGSAFSTNSADVPNATPTYLGTRILAVPPPASASPAAPRPRG